MSNENFHRHWPAAPKIVRDLFTPDDRQDWACPHCWRVYSSHSSPMLPDENQHWCDVVEMEPIPRLDQLVEMVKGKWKIGEVWSRSDIYFCMISTEVHPDGSPVWNIQKVGDSPEEAVLKAICEEVR